MADPRLCASMVDPHTRGKITALPSPLSATLHSDDAFLVSSEAFEVFLRLFYRANKICVATLSSYTQPFNSFSTDSLIAMPNAHPSVPDLTFSVPPATSVCSSADADLLNPALGLNAAPVVDAERHATVIPLDEDPLAFQCLSSVGMAPVQEPATEAIVDCTTRLVEDSTLHDAPFLNIDMDQRETIPYDTDLTQTVFGNKNPASGGKLNKSFVSALCGEISPNNDVSGEGKFLNSIVCGAPNVLGTDVFYEPKMVGINPIVKIGEEAYNGSLSKCSKYLLGKLTLPYGEKP